MPGNDVVTVTERPLCLSHGASGHRAAPAAVFFDGRLGGRRADHPSGQQVGEDGGEDGDVFGCNAAGGFHFEEPIVPSVLMVRVDRGIWNCVPGSVSSLMKVTGDAPTTLTTARSPLEQTLGSQLDTMRAIACSQLIERYRKDIGEGYR